MPDREIRHYVVLRPPEVLREAYFKGDIAAVLNYIAAHIYPSMPPLDLPLRVVALPDKEIAQRNAGAAAKLLDEDGEYVVALEFRDRDAVDRLREIIGKDPSFVASSADLPFGVADHWCSGDAGDPAFTDRFAAERLIGVEFLRQQGETTGEGVNVVIVDQGLDKTKLRGNYAGGWNVGGQEPGKGPASATDSHRRSHGMMIAQNILSVAPGVALFDLPLAPPRISSIPRFLSWADPAFRVMLRGIEKYRESGGRHSGPWVLVNPWGVHDTATEYPAGNYTNNAGNRFNTLVAGAVNAGIDVVFAAGNCGQFCPDRRCAPNVVGPGRSILGANSLADVLTVGAVRADAVWLGYSAQGPGQPGFGPDAREKPDICAPSQFRETDDFFSLNTGTSAACALAGGVVAALRSKWKHLRPGEMKKTLIETARRTDGCGWDARTGHGILDARAAFARLDALPNV